MEEDTQQSPHWIRKSLGVLAYSVYSLTIVGMLCLSVFSTWFLWYAQTWQGRGLAVLGLLLSLFPGFIAWWFWKPASRQLVGWSMLGGMLCCVLLVVGLLMGTPSGIPANGSAIRHIFTGNTQFSPYRVANIVPEIEQINLGFFLMSRLDPRFPPVKARRVAVITQQLYREMEQDPDFHALGSVMRWAYAELLGQPFDVGHSYLYLPDQCRTRACPMLVFLHGSVGNFKVYMWLWSQLAEHEDLVVLAPSYGFGNWASYPSSPTVVLRALQQAEQQFSLDSERVYLVGLSNGGLGVSKVAAEAPEHFQGLIFLSPVFDTHVLAASTFQQAWRHRPILVITGAHDERVPLVYVQEHVALLQQAGSHVTERIYAHEDHFLFFSQASMVLQDIARWLRDVS